MQIKPLRIGGGDVKEIKILRVFAHTNLCRTKKMPYICPVL